MWCVAAGEVQSRIGVSNFFCKKIYSKQIRKMYRVHVLYTVSTRREAEVIVYN